MAFLRNILVTNLDDNAWSVRIGEMNMNLLHVFCLPAPIVSPPRLIKILPMSLLAAKVSSGIGRTMDEPDSVVLRNVI